MMERSIAAGQIRPGQLTLSTKGACRFDPQHLLAVFARQRRRFAAVLAGFTPGDWAARTRCADWSAHDVVRHLCDCNASLGGTDQRLLDPAAGFDPRTTPATGRPSWPASHLTPASPASWAPPATCSRWPAAG
jgi:hypothetical protein